MIEAIDKRLWRWAEYAMGLGLQGGGSLLGKYVDEGWAALSRGTGWRRDPVWPADVELTERALARLEIRDQRFARAHYRSPDLSLEQKAQIQRRDADDYRERLGAMHARLDEQLAELEGE